MRGRVGTIVISVTVLVALAGTAEAGDKYQVLYSFPDTSQGSEPVANVTFDKSGNIYGVSNWPGGSVFERVRRTDGS